MPNSLIPDYPLVTTEAPRPNLSSSEIAAPIRNMAEALDKSGAAITEVATDVAQRAGEEAGRKSVRTDDAGNLVVDDTRNPFIIGPAAKAYERSAKIAQAAQIEPQVSTKMLQLRLDHPNDPGGFAAAAKQYSDTLLNGDPDKGTPGIQDPHIRGAVSDMITTNTQHNLRSSLIETNQHNIAESLQTYQARIKDTVEQMSSLARQGAGTAPVDSEAYKTFQAKANDLATFYRELGNDPRFRFSPERARIELDEAYSNFKVQDVIGKVQRQFFQDHDFAKATTSLQNAFWGPGSENLNLKSNQRDKGVSEGLAHLRNMATIDHAAVADNTVAVNRFIEDQMHRRPNNFDETQYNNFLQRSLDIGDRKSVTELQANRDFLPVFSAESRMSPTQRAAALRDLDRAVIPKAPDADTMAALGADKSTSEFFAGRGGRFAGVNPEFAGRLRTAIEAYETQNPGEKVSLNSLVRTREEQAAAYARYQSGAGGLAAPPGQSRHEFGEAADIPPGKFLDFLHRNAADYGLEFLKGQAFYKDPVHVQLPHGPLVPGATVNLAENQAYGRVLESAVKVYRDRVTRDAERETADVLDRIEKGHSFAPGQLENLGNLIGASGKTELLEKVRPALASQDIGRLLPPGEAPSNVNDAVQQTIAAGVPTDMRTALIKADDRFKADYQAMHADPLGYGPKAEWFGAVNPINTQAPDSWVGNFQDRNTKIGAAQAWISGLGPVSALRPDEANGAGVLLSTGDPKMAAQMLDSIRFGLSPENWRATMASEPVKNAVIGMARSNDPTRMTAGMLALDRLWTANAPEFEKTYGEHTLTRLLAWKGLAALSPEERVERLNKADDASEAEGRAKVAKALDEEFRSWKPTDVAYELGNSWGVPVLSYGIPFISHFQNIITQSTPKPPIDSVKAFAMQDEYERTVKALRMYDVDPVTARSYAIQQMRSRWQPTRLVEGAGPVLMKHAPEAYYPQVDGSHDWMKRDLNEFVSKVYGDKQEQRFSGGFEGEIAPLLPGWSLRNIVSDAQTERDIAQGLPPSYRIHIVDGNGQDQIVRNPVTGADRIRFDPKSVITGRESDFNRMHSRFQSQYARDLAPGKPPVVGPGGFQSLGATPFMMGNSEREPMARQ